MLTTKEAAKTLSVEPQTIRNYIRNGIGVEGKKDKLIAMYVMRGRRKEYRIKISDLDAFKVKYLTLID